MMSHNNQELKIRELYKTFLMKKIWIKKRNSYYGVFLVEKNQTFIDFSNLDWSVVLPEIPDMHYTGRRDENQKILYPQKMVKDEGTW